MFVCIEKNLSTHWQGNPNSLNIQYGIYKESNLFLTSKVKNQATQIKNTHIQGKSRQFFDTFL